MTTLSSLVAPYKKVPLGLNNGVLLEMVNPLGYTDADYNPAVDYNAVVQCAYPANLLYSTGTWALDSNGYATTATGYGTIVGMEGHPIHSSGMRKYETWGKTKDGTPTTSAGTRILFNYLDGNNYWLVDLDWNGSAFELAIYSNQSGTPTTHVSMAAATTVDWPMRWHLVVYDFGDTIQAGAHVWEEDVPADDDGLHVSYTVASRPNKSASKFTFTAQAAAANEWYWRGVRVSDIV